jgi:hypothetical protein
MSNVSYGKSMVFVAWQSLSFLLLAILTFILGIASTAFDVLIPSLAESPDSSTTLVCRLSKHGIQHANSMTELPR